MAESGLRRFIDTLEKSGELNRIKTFCDPVLEISEITDRVTKNRGKALLFENNGSGFPVLINAFGSDKRMAMALGIENVLEAGKEFEELFNQITIKRNSFISKISGLPALLKLAGYFPSKLKKRGICQQVIHNDPDLGILPVLKCWPFDGGRFITLPMVHTIHPVTGKPNLGMYRMQILDRNTTAMHWQMHKTGAAHFREWKKINKRMPVSVSLGGDPVYTYASTAPLPENIDEFILAGFLRKKKVRLVKCLTNDIYVPFDCDIVIEGYVDPDEEPAWEGPFGDHTGFYSLADWYPRFHVTCITHSGDAVFPATIVGIPPQEDAWLIKTTENIFLSPLRLTLQPEIEDFHMPEPGTAHNLVIVKIKKDYPGQGMKVINSLLGTGQMMFTKYLVVTSGNVDIRNYYDLLIHVFTNTDFGCDVSFTRGPLDVLDHASDTPAFGGKAGIDATVKLPEELTMDSHSSSLTDTVIKDLPDELVKKGLVTGCNNRLVKNGIPLLIVASDSSSGTAGTENLKKFLRESSAGNLFRIILIVDHPVDVNDYYTVAWQVLANSDPYRDHESLLPSSIIFDGTVKAFRKGGFPRRWPNIVCADIETVKRIDNKWSALGIGDFLVSPSVKKMELLRSGNDEILTF